MNKTKKMFVTLCTIIMLTLILSVSANAATNDHYHTFAWGDVKVSQVPTPYKKSNNSATYFRVTDNSMPVNGFYIKTTLVLNGNEQSSSSSYYLVNTYGGKTIKHNVNASGKYAGLRTYYPESHWSWGNVTIAWSEDYVEDGSARLNW